MPSSARKKASPLLEEALKRVAALPRDRQDWIAAQIIDTLNRESDANIARHHQLIERKYTGGLTSAEITELASLEAGFQIQDELFYAPILERIAKSE
mgnify:CR=1 FL=1